MVWYVLLIQFESDMYLDIIRTSNNDIVNIFHLNIYWQ